MKRWLAMIVLATTFGSTSVAHERSESYSHWYANETGITASVTIPLREVMLLYLPGNASVPPNELFRDHVAAQTRVNAGPEECEHVSANILQAPSGFVRIETQFDCAESAPDSIRYRALFDVAPGHVHYAKLHRGGPIVAEVLITDSNDTWNIGEIGTTPDSSFIAYLVVGVEHISSGLDHIAFLLGLLLIAGSIGRCVIAITGFTLGHSISLVAAVLGYLQADSQLVEAFIGFTIALVAVEFFLARSPPGRTIPLLAMISAWLLGALALFLQSISSQAYFAYLGFGIFAACYLVISRELAEKTGRRATLLLLTATTCFGLVHGFGFAGFLMETGIVGRSLFVPLLGFNLGVEVGQLLLVGAALLIARLAARITPNFAPQLIAAGLCGIGVFWFVGRTLG